MPFDGTEGVFEALREARRLLLERGWCKGVMEDSTGRVCLFWAIRQATHGWNGNPLYGLVCERIKLLIGGGEISPWNDAQENEAAVIALLDRAIAWW